MWEWRTAAMADDDNRVTHWARASLGVHKCAVFANAREITLHGLVECACFAKCHAAHYPQRKRVGLPCSDRINPQSRIYSACE
jgi:hypothetical protein